MLWNRPGYAVRKYGGILGVLPGKKVRVDTDGVQIEEGNAGFASPYLALRLDRPVAVSTGGPVSAEALAVRFEAARAALLREAGRFGALSDAYLAMSSCLSWDTVFEPEKARMCSPVSRIWSAGWGGYVLFCWDTFFSAMMSIPVSQVLAKANLYAILGEKTEAGFVPNFGAANDYKTRDRSQPPVGALAVREVCRCFGDRTLAASLFDSLLEWNRWFAEHRMLPTGQLCWGSDPYAPREGRHWESDGVGDSYGAALESGMDNSPLYDGVPFDPETHLMCLADVGLCGLYIMDCEVLAELAGVLERDAERAELLSRAEKCKAGMEELWCEEAGMYLNRRTDTGAFSPRMGPTNFYALFSDRVAPERVRRMLGHFHDPKEFAGTFMIPSVARNDPAYADQEYWRGRIWPPHNFLVYLALRRQGCAAECRMLAEKSVALLLGEWREHGHVHENYGGESGLGCDVESSDPFYHWGGLMALTALYEAGALGDAQKPLRFPEQEAW